MDPVSVGMAVAALLAKQAAEGLGGEAGKGAWGGMKRLYGLVRQRFASHRETQASLERLETDPDHEEHQRAVAQAIAAQAQADRTFGQELEELVTDAQRHPDVGPIVTQVFGQAHVGKMATFGNVEGDVIF